MNFPLFPIGQDPGPNFMRLLEQSGVSILEAHHASSNPQLNVPHGTTIIAIRYQDGVVMAGDRRATEGHAIAHRRIEKVHPADLYSGVAIAGAAGPAMELVKLFQTQLQHYEKVEGTKLSLEGKANQLSHMVRSNLAMAMQGLVVVPLFAGYDLEAKRGRIYTYDVTGGRYEEIDYQATGSGGRDARTTIKLGFRDDLSRNDVITLAIQALYEAADEDSATGGPDIIRGIFPTVASVTEEGFQRVDDDEVSEVFNLLIGNRQSARSNRPIQGPKVRSAKSTSSRSKT